MARTPPNTVIVPSPFSGTAARAGAAARTKASARRIWAKIHADSIEIVFPFVSHGARTRDGFLLRADHRAAGAGGGRLSLPHRRCLGVRRRSGGDVAGGGAAGGGHAVARSGPGDAGARVRLQLQTHGGGDGA